MTEMSTIKIHERDTQTDVLVCIDLDRNIWIKRGFPRNQETGFVDQALMENLSGPPYVFTASKITLKDIKHPNGVVLSDVNVIFMHAGSNGSGPWVFSSFTDGYPVVETVNKTNEYLNRNGEPPVQVVLACNHRTADEMNIKVGDFPPNSGIVYAVGETVILNSAFMDIGGKIVVMASADQFWGIEEAQLSQQIQIL